MSAHASASGYSTNTHPPIGNLRLGNVLRKVPEKPNLHGSLPNRYTASTTGVWRLLWRTWAIAGRLELSGSPAHNHECPLMASLAGVQHGRIDQEASDRGPPPMLQCPGQCSFLTVPVTRTAAASGPCAGLDQRSHHDLDAPPRSRVGYRARGARARFWPGPSGWELRPLTSS